MASKFAGIVLRGSLRAATVFVQTNLTSDINAPAANTGSHLKNPWGMSFGPTTPFWISDQFRVPGSGFDPNALFFTVGIDGEARWTLRRDDSAREPSSIALPGPGGPRPSLPQGSYHSRLASRKLAAKIGWNPIR